MADSFVPIETDSWQPMAHESGTPIRSFNIIDIRINPEGYEIVLDMDLDSGYEIEGAKMKVTFEDLAGYETEDIHQGVRYTLGFFG